ncbi:oxidoreductase [Erysipelothrix larvae]|uniref:Oxidoreductase n=1 Tax=Erysipelothrix larvae TaxID=1514105 RepID=A0A109UH63_9FIRM|nr:aldo/keto reductase [Erysipelothrix larvae]AMC93628.1 oxidoreductase [Erysipelothrix larvae]
MEAIMMNNGLEIPAFGLGTYRVSPTDVEQSIEVALNNGYRLIDTANVYLNEKAIGRALKKSQVPRKEIFLTSKIWPADFNYEKAKIAIDKTLSRLDTDYLDLLLLHQEVGDIMGAWKALEEAVVSGKVKSIGVCNFGEANLKKLLHVATIKPVLVQNECHPYLQETEFINFLKKEGILLEAWYPLGSGDKNLINEPIFTKLSKKYNKSNVQILLRWHLQADHIVIPGSKTPSHIISNIDIFDFELSPEDMKEIEKLNKNKRYFKIPHFIKKVAFTLPIINFDRQK